jgi:hypothetical protein
MNENHDSPMAELGQMLRSSEARFAANRWWQAKFWLGVIADIYGDARDHWARVGADAHRAECADREAIASLEMALQGLRDGRVDPQDVQAIRSALKNTRRSANIDHSITEAAS